ncbi:MAG TPA: dihydrodipicolinate synthase family protein [Bryobacteraceae bacterium]|nr:dihydrodipicolinate synthase family protein [Bryobacteraceae bacterium]
MTKLEGVYPILNTTFHDDGSLDLPSQSRLVEHLLEAGAHGLGLFGNASEGYALVASERVEILKLVRREVNGRVPLVVSSGHTGTDAAVELSREAEALGADALMVLPPYYLKTDGDGLMFYFEAISKAVNIPIMVQDAPLLTAVAMPAALLSRMGREIEHVRYAKVEAPPTAPKVSAVAAAGGVIPFAGLNGQFMIEEVERGARGVMPGSDMIPQFVDIWNSLAAGDTAEAWRVFTRALPLMRFELQPGMGVSAMKHNLVAAGVIRSARVRHPTASLDARSLKELEFLRSWAGSGSSLEPV